MGRNTDIKLKQELSGKGGEEEGEGAPREKGAWKPQSRGQSGSHVQPPRLGASWSIKKTSSVGEGLGRWGPAYQVAESQDPGGHPGLWFSNMSSSAEHSPQNNS